MTKINYEIKNIVATGKLDFKPNLNLLALELEHSEYEPQQFSGLIYRLIEPKTTFLIYSSGKFLCVGCRNNKEIENSITQLFKTLSEFKENGK